MVKVFLGCSTVQKYKRKNFNLGNGHCVSVDRVPVTLSFFGQKNGQVVGGVQSSSNFSPSVAITFISSQCILGCTESNVSQKKQTSISQIPWWLEQQGYLQVHRISHWLCWCDSGIWGWLIVVATHRVVLATPSLQRKTPRAQGLESCTSEGPLL